LQQDPGGRVVVVVVEPERVVVEPDSVVVEPDSVVVVLPGETPGQEPGCKAFLAMKRPG
jgi:hypothetical protein